MYQNFDIQWVNSWHCGSLVAKCLYLALSVKNMRVYIGCEWQKWQTNFYHIKCNQWLCNCNFFLFFPSSNNWYIHTTYRFHCPPVRVWAGKRSYPKRRASHRVNCFSVSVISNRVETSPLKHSSSSSSSLVSHHSPPSLALLEGGQTKWKPLFPESPKVSTTIL